MKVLISNVDELAEVVENHKLNNLQTANLINHVYGIIPLAHLTSLQMVEQLREIGADNIPCNELPKFGKHNPTIFEILNTPFRPLLP